MSNMILMSSHIPEMITIKEAARRTGISYDCIRKLCLQKKIVHIRAGSKFLINFGMFCKYLNEGEQGDAADE